MTMKEWLLLGTEHKWDFVYDPELSNYDARR